MEFSVLNDNILYEDEDIIVLNKPAGWVVNRAATYTDVTIQDWMETKLKGSTLKVKSGGGVTQDEDNEYGTPEEIFALRTGIVHRLDKDTSGTLLLAKNPVALAELMRQFRERETEKAYVALVHGKLIPSSGTIRLPMDRSFTERKKFSIQPGGRMSETEYKLLEHYPGLPKGISPKKGKSYQGFSLVELTPKTGRTHQIRVHMSAIKHPLVGDSMYAGKKRIALDNEWCPRQFLHAKKLCFTHPTSQERVCFESPLASDLSQVLESLQPLVE
jgi:23S rRNA pseudouridine1911/1915/1917 synthase